MDRLNRGLLAGRMAMAVAVAFCCSQGCRSTHSEVPAGKPYQTTGGAPPSVGFSTEPHPNLATGMASLYGNKAPGSLVQDGRGDSSNPGGLVLGTPTQGPATLGAPTDNRYGPPGTASTGDSASSGSSSSSGSSTLANALLKSIPPASQMVAKDPEAIPGSAGSAGGSYP
jgi:hypothetical protein